MTIRYLALAFVAPVAGLSIVLEALGVPYSLNVPGWAFDRFMRWFGGFPNV